MHSKGAVALLAAASVLGLLLGAGKGEARLLVDDPHNRELHGASDAAQRAQWRGSLTGREAKMWQDPACGIWRRKWQPTHGRASGF